MLTTVAIMLPANAGCTWNNIFFLFSWSPMRRSVQFAVNPHPSALATDGARSHPIGVAPKRTICGL